MALQSKPLQRLTFPLEIRQGVILENAVGLQESVHLNPGETEHFAQLWFRYPTRPELLQTELFQGAT